MAALLRSSPASWLGGLLAAAYLFPTAQAIYYNIDTPDQIRQSARTLAYDMMLFYKGNQSGQIPGILPGPPTEHLGDYYWWEGGAMMGTYIDYWHLTGDDSYNAVVTQGMLHQVGEDQDYQPENHTASLGNDDQGFWGMSAMLAAEVGFPDPPPDQPQWLALAQAVFNTQADPARHDEYCGGGLRWQIPRLNAGFNYKNTIANACFFNLGARLARYTGNQTYSDWANKQFDWLYNVGYIHPTEYRVFDGGHIEENCTDINKAQFSYNAALLLHGSAFMYNYTDGTPEQDKWKNRIDKLLWSIKRDFFPDGIAFEMPCEGHGGCSPDMLSFKGYVHRWLAVVSQIAWYKRTEILDLLAGSTKAAVAQCTGGETGRRCGFYWSKGVYVDPAVDKTSGAGEAMNVLAAVSSLLIEETKPPHTNETGGTSKGDYAAGTHTTIKEPLRPITAGDRAGAAILTILILASGMGMFGYMSFGD